MGNPTGFLEVNRKNTKSIPPKKRLKGFEEFHINLPDQDRLKQASRCMDCGVPFCQYGMDIGSMTSGCPLNNLIPEWNDMLYKGNIKEAYRRLIKTNNFPEFTARVCPALCEAACTLGYDYEPVTTKENALYIIEKAYETGLAGPNPPKRRSGKHIAIVGSGPAGLSAADLLNKRGHEITVFEKSQRAGGLLMNGIPNMKLDKSIIDRKLNIMKEEGIEFITGVDIKSLNQLNDYDSVVLACGSLKPRDIDVNGRKGKDIYFAVDFLTSVTDALLDDDMSIVTAMIKDKKVVIIGGGDTGNDCLGTSIRLGAKSVVQLEMMPKPPVSRNENNPWPQWPKVLKTDYGQEEAIDVFGSDPRIFSITPTEFIRNDNGDIKGVKTIKLDSNMKRIENTEAVIKADVIIIAAGFTGPEEYLIDELKIKIEKDNHFTNLKKFFVAGDMKSGPSIVVKAIKEGRDVAALVDKELMGYTNIK